MLTGENDAEAATTMLPEAKRTTSRRYKHDDENRNARVAGSWDALKATFHLEVTGTDHDPAVSDGVELGPRDIDGVRVEIDRDSKTRRLIKVRIIVIDAEICLDSSTGAIRSTYPELQAKVFSVASYVANVLRIETGIDSINPYDVIHHSPEIEPESSKEEAIFQSHTRTVEKAVSMSWSVHRLLPSDQWDQWLARGNSEAMRKAAASFAVGLRADSPFLRYEQFWKVIEHFFPEDSGKHLDDMVAAHLSTYDSDITNSMVENVRQVRIRCVHSMPKSAGTHLSPSEIKDIQEINQNLPTIEKIARLLLYHPPST